MRINIFMLSAENDTLKTILRNMHRGVLSYYASDKLSTTVTDENFIQTQRLLKREDIWVDNIYAEKYKPCDVAIQFGSAKARDALHHIVKTDIKENAKNIVYVETPLLGRAINNKHNYEFYRLGVNGFLYGEGNFNCDNSPPDRWNMFKSLYGYKDFSGWKDHTKGPILLLAQLPGDASLRTQDMAEWVKETISNIRSITDRKIIIRLHPAMSEKGRNAFIGDLSELILENDGNISFSKNTLNQDLNKAGICISYTSGSSIDAILAGVPCIACDEGNFTWPISSHSWEDINEPYLADKEVVQQWLYDLSYCQWSVDEIKTGKAWAHLAKVIESE